MIKWTFRIAWLLSLLIGLIAAAAWAGSYHGFLPFYYWPGNGSHFNISTFKAQVSFQIILSRPANIDWNRADPIIRERPGVLWDQIKPLPGLRIYHHRTVYDHSSGGTEIGDEYVNIDLRYALLVVICALLPMLAAARWMMAKRKYAAGLCPKCGYDLRATPSRCPECGFTPA